MNQLNMGEYEPMHQTWNLILGLQLGSLLRLNILSFLLIKKCLNGAEFGCDVESLTHCNSASF